MCVCQTYLHEYKSIWNALIRQVQHVLSIQHYITASAEEQTVLQAFHVLVDSFEGPQQLLTDRIQPKSQQLLVGELKPKVLLSHDAP